MKIISTKAGLAALLEVTPGDIDNVIARLPKFYTKKTEPKPNGGQRVFYVPHGRLRAFQDKIKTHILDKARFAAYLYGGIKRKSAIKNARNHSGKEAVLALDIKSFFPSIRPERVLAVFERLGYIGEAGRILTRLTTYEYQLPQGPPTSPAIANLAVPRLDARLSGLARSQGLSHTRFVDDMTLSGSRRLAKFSRLAARIVEEDGFKVKQGPRGQLMPQDRRQSITGLSVNFKLNVARHKRNEVLADSVRRLREGLRLDDSTQGKLAWLNSANPKVGTRLIKAAKQLRDTGKKVEAS